MVESPHASPQVYGDDLKLKELLFSFDGRIGRQTYWLSSIGLSLATAPLVLALTALSEEASPIFNIVLLILMPIFIWAILAIQVKRWHDRDKSGWWVLIGFVPLFGSTWALIETGFLRGTVGPNRFGEDPLRRGIHSPF